MNLGLEQIYQLTLSVFLSFPETYVSSFVFIGQLIQLRFKLEKRALKTVRVFFQVVELKPGGSQIPVTELNKKEYLDLFAQYRLASSVKQEIEAFAKGSP